MALGPFNNTSTIYLTELSLQFMVCALKRTRLKRNFYFMRNLFIAEICSKFSPLTTKGRALFKHTFGLVRTLRTQVLHSDSVSFLAALSTYMCRFSYMTTSIVVKFLLKKLRIFCLFLPKFCSFVLLRLLGSVKLVEIFTL